MEEFAPAGRRVSYKQTGKGREGERSKGRT